MLCEICKKEPANVYFTQVVNGKMTKMHFCESCAEKSGMEKILFPKGINSLFSDFALDGQVGLDDLLEGLTDFGILTGEEKLKCPNCNLSHDDFKSTGFLGCSECYTAFRTNLIPVLKSIHGRTQHAGKVPSKSEELLLLQGELKSAIQKEEYEIAAKIRDKINELKKENGN